MTEQEEVQALQDRFTQAQKSSNTLQKMMNNEEWERYYDDAVDKRIDQRIRYNVTEYLKQFDNASPKLAEQTANTMVDMFSELLDRGQTPIGVMFTQGGMEALTLSPFTMLLIATIAQEVMLEEKNNFLALQGQKKNGRESI